MGAADGPGGALAPPWATATAAAGPAGGAKGGSGGGGGRINWEGDTQILDKAPTNYTQIRQIEQK